MNIVNIDILGIRELKWFRMDKFNSDDHYMGKRASQVVLVVKNSPANAGDLRDLGSTPGLGRYLGEGHGNPFKYSCLVNPMDRRAWWPWGVHSVETCP